MLKNKQIILSILLVITLDNAFAQCAQNEATVFSGLTEKKVIAICATPQKPPYSKIEYRYGLTGKPEFVYLVDGKSGNMFNASTEACSPRQSTNNIWFKNGDITYFVSECRGGGCDFEGGILVIKNKKIIAKIKSKSNSEERFEFTNDILNFDTGSSKIKIRSNFIQEKDLDKISSCELYE